MSETSESDSEYNSSDEEVSITISLCAYHLYHAHSNLTSFNSRVQLQEAFAKGLLKPGLNVAVETSGKQSKNYVVSDSFIRNYYSTFWSSFIVI